MRHQATSPQQVKIQRCAIYTRKSTDHNLDLAFNSLDAQREACEAYIRSQAHEGWRLVPDHLDDGAFSGASLDRPALKQLLDMVRAKRIDVIVVYKVDRLTRALADFAKLVELFDANGVSFVSVTQSFNTTSSMGRLTLNVLLSFAQFEREVIGERVRDKISASKRKGIWVGGPIPLGYQSVDKKLVVIPGEAELVRQMFADYLRLGSVSALTTHLNRTVGTPKPRQLANGKTRQASFYRVGPVAHMLKNRFYIGEVAYQGEVHPGEHEAIVDRETFEAVQCSLLEKAVARKISRTKATSAFPLTGRIFDDRHNPMSPSHANKKGVRYRYYVSQALLQGRKDEAGSIARASAPNVERLVIDGMRAMLAASASLDLADRDLARRHLISAVVCPTAIAITFSPTTLLEDATDDFGSHRIEQAIDTVTIEVPWTRSSHPRKGLAHEPAEATGLTPVHRDKLLTAIARARDWMGRIANGQAKTFAEIAAAEKLDERHIRFLAPLAFVAPQIIEAIANGSAPDTLTVSGLARALPHRWSEQHRQVRL